MELNRNDHPITTWLKNASLLNFSVYASVVSFCLYTCIFSLRKTFGVATYEGLSYWGVDYKAWMVIFQVVGYLISKFIGIKIGSELKSKHRARGILLMVSIASISWLFFAITPSLLFCRMKIDIQGQITPQEIQSRPPRRVSALEELPLLKSGMQKFRGF